MRIVFQHLLSPHHTNNYRARVLHPAGLSVMIALFLLTQSTMSVWRAIPVLPGGLVLGYASSITASQTVEMTNRQRAQLGLPALKVSSKLNEAAVAKASHMFANNYWNHIAPDGTTPWTFIRGAGYDYAVAGENLARDFDATDGMMNAWMNSPTHKENIVNSKYSEIGVAVVDGLLEGVETTLVVQMFGKPAQGVIAAETSDVGISTETLPPEPLAARDLDILTQTETPLAVTENNQEANDLIEREIARAQAQSPAVASDTLGVTLTAPSGRAVGSLMISPLTLTKTIATSMLLLVSGLLLYDALVVHRKQLTRTIGRNWAHLTLFAFALLVVLTVTQGQIL